MDAVVAEEMPLWQWEAEMQSCGILQAREQISIHPSEAAIESHLPHV